jgi:nucleoside permease NupC
VYLAVLVGNDEVNLNYLIGKLFIPIAFIMGVPSEDVEEVET